MNLRHEHPTSLVSILTWTGAIPPEERPIQTTGILGFVVWGRLSMAPADK